MLQNVNIHTNSNMVIYLGPNSVDVYTRHPNMGKVKWFSIEKDGKFSSNTSATEEWIIGVLTEVFAKPSQKAEKNAFHTEKILAHPIFGKWWKERTHQLRGKIIGKSYGV